MDKCQQYNSGENRAIIALIVLGIGWAISSYITKILQQDIKPLEQMMIQSVLVLPFSLLFALSKVRATCLLSFSAQDALIVMLRALVNVTGALLVIISIKHTTLANVAWLSALPYPVLWAWILYRELPNKYEAVWILMTLAGAVLITVTENTSFIINIGAIYAILGNLLFALGLTTAKTIHRRLGAISGYFWTTCAFAFFSVLAGLVFEGWPEFFSYKIYITILIGSVLWAINAFTGLYGFARLNAGVANGIVSTECLWALLIGVVFLAEIPSSATLIGGALIFIATIALCLQKT